MCVLKFVSTSKTTATTKYTPIHSSFTNRRTIIKTMITIYIKIRWFLHVSVYDHYQGACSWAWLKLYSVIIRMHDATIKIVQQHLIIPDIPTSEVSGEKVEVKRTKVFLQSRSAGTVHCRTECLPKSILYCN